jgi:leucyl aminopeptidase
VAEPTFASSEASVASIPADLLILPVFRDRSGVALGPGAAEIASAAEIDLLDALRRTGTKGGEGDRLLIPAVHGIGARAILVVGVGDEPGASSLGSIQLAATLAGAASRAHPVVATTLTRDGSPEDPERAAAAFAEGFLLGAYRFDRYRSAPEPALTQKVVLLVNDASVVDQGLAHGVVTGRATNRARDRVHTPAGDATPKDLADEAVASADRMGLTQRRWTADDLESDGFGGILGVGRGSSKPPQMVELRYRGRGDAAPIAITGKGITFDSGGLILKRAGGEINFMKSDMASAAAALSAIEAVAELQVPVDVICLLPFAENMPGSDAIRVGDVVRHYGGRTSEVLDTDAEGRVLLADALAYLTEQRPSVIVDSGTLTDGSGMGPDMWAAMGNDEGATAEIVAAGEESGDPGWAIPLHHQYRTLLDSKIADIKNIGEHGYDTAMIAGLFLRDFVGSTPWVHLDTGSCAWVEWDTKRFPEGATGSPTRALIRFIERRAERGA